MKKIMEALRDLGLKVTNVKEIAPFTISVFYLDGYNEFFTKYFFLGPKGNVVSKHNGKYVLPIEDIPCGYNAGKLLEKENFFLFKPLPVDLDIDGVVYKISYKKDVWGW